ncbi:hypothetical protein P280DRAFT_83799 [Massarina eburnea CBS 473.64]|uniref:Transmembrane 9 superfamily member n=1 Tax=Massarina eburnea CBS 473.64 TaxID=1395130 RepID=A0A6A6RTD4_9PLEO|nr:hypothetical protein P280DRAFT_83799 [Massarina eburnea CBS 473.64]
MEGMEIPFTYSVYWREEKVPKKGDRADVYAEEKKTLTWENRWDVYAGDDEEKSELARRVRMLGGVVLALGAVAAIAACVVGGTKEGAIRLSANSKSQLKVIKMDREKENGKREKKKNYGLLIHVDDVDVASSSSSDDGPTYATPIQKHVFNSPSYANILPPLIGAGIQSLSTATIYTLLYTTNILSPHSSLYPTTAFLLWSSSTIYSGSISSTLYKTYNGQAWRRNALITVSILPGTVSTFLNIVNLSVWWQTGGSFMSLASPIVLGTVWVAAQAGFVYVGAWWGFSYAAPYRVTSSRREIGTRLPSYGFGSRTSDRRDRKTVGRVMAAGMVPFVLSWVAAKYVFKSVDGVGGVDIESAGLVGVGAMAAIGFLYVVLVGTVVLGDMWVLDDEVCLPLAPPFVSFPPLSPLDCGGLCSY